MGERVKVNSKSSEAKRENSASKAKKTDFSNSMNSPIDHILFLQRTVGNQAVQRLIKSGVIQGKLRINQPGDIYEQEADRVADQVMRIPETQIQQQPEEEEKEKITQLKPLAEQITPLVQRQVKEKEKEELTLPELPPMFGSGNFTYAYDGKKALTGANARWEANYEAKAHVEKKDKKWFGILDKLDAEAKYWLNSKAKWNHIKDFPGGSYDPKFNTPEGSMTHEEAELVAVGTLWENMQKNIEAGIKKGFKTKKGAGDNFKKVCTKEFKKYRKKQLAISNHTNPVGPNAEWNYYKEEYDKYKASLKKEAPKKKAP